MLDSQAVIIGAIGTDRLAQALSLKRSVVASWRTRNSIPARYLLPVAEFAQSVGIDVTVEMLAAIAARDMHATPASEVIA